MRTSGWIIKCATTHVLTYDIQTGRIGLVNLAKIGTTSHFESCNLLHLSYSYQAVPLTRIFRV